MKINELTLKIESVQGASELSSHNSYKFVTHGTKMFIFGEKPENWLNWVFDIKS